MAKRKKDKWKPLKIRVDDKVIVISGEDKSATPRKVLSVNSREGRVIVEGVNVMKDSQSKQQGGGDNVNTQDYIEKPCAIDASNVMLVDPESSKPTRIRLDRSGQGQAKRVAVRSGQEV